LYQPVLAFRFGYHQCIQDPLQRAADPEGNHRPLQDATKMKLNELYAMSITGEGWQLTTPTTIKNY
jgi:hypothetical protein